MNKICRIVVLISGNGSNLQAIIDRINSDNYPVTIEAVISNKADAYGLVRAKRAAIATHVVDHHVYNDRQTFDEALIKLIDHYQPDFVILAGFMRILTKAFVDRYMGRLINIHPSLLPKYPGLNTHQQVLDAGDKVHGCSVHFVTPEVDGGPVIIQASMATEPTMSVDTLKLRVNNLEHKIYPLVVKWLAENRLLLTNGVVFLDKKTVPVTGYIYEEN